MLPAAQRLADGAAFQHTVRRGRRCGSSTVVAHFTAEVPEALGESRGRIGFVVSKAVGNAVARNRVKRRLRHICRELPVALPASGVLVVRALPGSSTASTQELRADLAHCLDKLVRRP